MGTEFALFFTIDGGQNWIRLSAGVPTIQFRDLELHRRENDLLCATFGRGIYVLDDYTPLRYIDPGTLAQKASLFPPRCARVYDELDYVVAAFGNFTRANPPFGVMLHYYLGEEFASSDCDKIVISITDVKGEPVRQITCPTTLGLHRVVWDLRRSPRPQEQENSQTRRGSRPGALVEPGKYTISLLKIINDKETSLAKSQAIQVKAL